MDRSLLTASLCLAGFISSASAEVIVMSRNVYLGANLNPVIGAIATGNPATISAASAAAYQDVVASNFAERAAAVAAEIQASGAMLVGLQEVALYRSGTFGDAAAATQVELDYLDTLLTELGNRGLNYAAVAVGTNVDTEVGSVIGGVQRDLRYTNSDVILARTDLAPAQFSVSNPDAQLFGTALPVSANFAVERGYTSVDVTAGGTNFRFINTHLESSSSAVRIAQGNELLAGPLAGAGQPVVLVGDLNSRASGGTVYNNMIASGLIDAWTETNPGQPGFTSGTGIFDPVPSFDRRIDFVLGSSSLDFTSASVVGDQLSDRTPSGIWPSDHAGVVASIATVPEPSGVALLAISTIAFVRRRRNRCQDTRQCAG